MTKERLRSYQTIKAEHEQLKSLLAETELLKNGPKARRLDGSPSAKAHKANSTQERQFDSLEQLQGYYRTQIDALAAEQLAIETAIEALPSVERRLMRHKYIEGLTWEQVCTSMAYSWRQVHRLHSRALEHISK